MALPTTGPISMSQVASELGISTSNINLNLAAVRTMAVKPSGVIAMSHLRGKSAFAVVGLNHSGQSAVRVHTDDGFYIHDQFLLINIAFSDNSRVNAVTFNDTGGAGTGKAKFNVAGQVNQLRIHFPDMPSANRTCYFTISTSTGNSVYLGYSGPLGWIRIPMTDPQTLTYTRVA